MGPIELADFIGLDICEKIDEDLYKYPKNNFIHELMKSR